jgi:hypothetical protein
MRILPSIFACGAALLAAGCDSSKTASQPSGLPVRYDNAQYGLTFFLPAEWQGYSVLTKRWDASLHLADYRTVVGQEQGQIIILRNPQWKADDPYQDIPITVFTHMQWVAQAQERCFPYAGGSIGELWHNRKYVFGLHNRYLHGPDDAKGVEEVQDILKRNRAANAMPGLYDEKALISLEHDWRLAIGGHSFGLVQQADYYDFSHSRLICRTTTIYVGPFGATTTRVGAPFVAILLLLLLGVGGALFLMGLWPETGSVNEIVGTDTAPERHQSFLPAASDHLPPPIHDYRYS